jgi:hypothetical protein
LQGHDVAAWIKGRDAPSAAAALVYSVDVFSEDPVTNVRSLSTSQAEALKDLTKAARQMDDDGLGGLIGNDGGTLRRHANLKGTTVVFPAAITSNARLASRQVASMMR